jgi:hypothetical protein
VCCNELLPTSRSECYTQATDLLSNKAKQLDALMTAARVRQLMISSSTSSEAAKVCSVCILRTTLHITSIIPKQVRFKACWVHTSSRTVFENNVVLKIMLKLCNSLLLLLFNAIYAGATAPSSVAVS